MRRLRAKDSPSKKSPISKKVSAGDGSRICQNIDFPAHVLDFSIQTLKEMKGKTIETHCFPYPTETHIKGSLLSFNSLFKRALSIVVWGYAANPVPAQNIRAFWETIPASNSLHASSKSDTKTRHAGAELCRKSISETEIRE